MIRWELFLSFIKFWILALHFMLPHSCLIGGKICDVSDAFLMVATVPSGALKLQKWQTSEPHYFGYCRASEPQFFWNWGLRSPDFFKTGGFGAPFLRLRSFPHGCCLALTSCLPKFGNFVWKGEIRSFHKNSVEWIEIGKKLKFLCIFWNIKSICRLPLIQGASFAFIPPIKVFTDLYPCPVCYFFEIVLENYSWASEIHS